MTTTNSDFIFTSYCFDNSASGGDYRDQQERLKQSIFKIYPNANLHFIAETEAIGKPKFARSMYGMKPHMINDCLRMGFKKIIFFDPAICLERPIDDWLELAAKHGILAAIDRTTLDRVCSDKCLKANNLTRDNVKDCHLVGGSMYIFDFNNPACNNAFRHWLAMEQDGLFGSQADQTNMKDQGHRCDETCMAIAMKFNNIDPMPHDVMRYAYENPGTKQLHSAYDSDPIVIKRHFK